MGHHNLSFSIAHEAGDRNCNILYKESRSILSKQLNALGFNSGFRIKIS